MKRISLLIFILGFLILNCLSTLLLVMSIDFIQNKNKKTDFFLVNLIAIH